MKVFQDKMSSSSVLRCSMNWGQLLQCYTKAASKHSSNTRILTFTRLQRPTLAIHSLNSMCTVLASSILHCSVTQQPAAAPTEVYLVQLYMYVIGAMRNFSVFVLSMKKSKTPEASHLIAAVHSPCSRIIQCSPPALLLCENAKSLDITTCDGKVFLFFVFVTSYSITSNICTN